MTNRSSGYLFDRNLATLEITFLVLTGKHQENEKNRVIISKIVTISVNTVINSNKTKCQLAEEPVEAQAMLQAATLRLQLHHQGLQEDRPGDLQVQHRQRHPQFQQLNVSQKVRKCFIFQLFDQLIKTSEIKYIKSLEL